MESYRIKIAGKKAEDANAIYELMMEYGCNVIGSRKPNSIGEPNHEDASYSYWGDLTPEQLEEELSAAMEERGIRGRLEVK